MACTYFYNGKQYTEYQLLKLIREGKIYKVANPEVARKWLRTKLGMSDNQIEIVNGLISDGVVGKLVADGKILLSDVMPEGTERHEAFHRVFRLFLTDAERRDILDEFKQRDNWESLLSKVKELYPEKDLDTQIEEYLADEFMVYSLSEGNYTVPTAKTKGFFGWLYNFFRSLFKLNIKDLYDNIERGKYATAKQTVYTATPADSRIKFPDGSNLDTETKQELLQHMTYKLLDQIFATNTIYDFVDGKLDATDMLTGVAVSAIQAIAKQNRSQAEKLVPMLLEAGKDNKPQVRSSSLLIQDLIRHFESLGLKTTLEEENYIESKEGSEDENEIAKDYSYMKVSFEFDPKANMSKAIRLLLASLPNDKASPILKIATSVPYNTVATVLFNELANTPGDMDLFKTKLDNIAAKHSWGKHLIKRLKFDNTADFNAFRFRNEFIKTFAKNKYEFIIGMLRNDKIYNTSAIINNREERIVQEWTNNMILRNGNTKKLLENINATKSITGRMELLGMDNLTTISGQTTPKGKSIENTINDIIAAIRKAGERDISIQDLFRKQEYDINVQGTVNMLAKMVVDTELPTDLMFYNAEGKKIYAISLNTYQTITLNYLNWIGTQGISLEEKIQLVRQYIPHVLNKDNIEIVGKKITFKSRWLSEILNGNKLILEVFDGIKGQQEKAFKDLDETDLFAFYLNSPLDETNATHIAVKHSDRSTLFAYKFSKPLMPVTQTSYDAILTSATNILTAYAQQEIDSVNDKTASTLKNFSKNKTKLQHFAFLKDTNKELQPQIRKHLEKKIDEFVAKMESEGLFKMYKGKPVGIGLEVWNKFSDNSKLPTAQKIKAIAALSYVNTFINRIEEQKIFLGDLRKYMNLDDAYKRFAMQSGTGDILVDDAYNNEYIRKELEANEFELYNPIDDTTDSTIYNKRHLGFFSEIVVEESKNYESGLLREYKDGISVLEHGFIVSLVPNIQKRLGVSEEEALRIAKQQAKKYTDKYRSMNENDGMSYISIFTWKEFEIRSGSWPSAKENTFQLELAALKLRDPSELATLEVYYDVANNKVSATPKEGYIIIKPFDLSGTRQDIIDYAKANNINLGKFNINNWFNDTFSPAAMLKPQYTGPVYRDIHNREVFDIAGRKTAYGVLMPSMILGTNLQKMNAGMITNNVDIIHMSSAAKYGYHEPKLLLKGSGSRIETEGNPMYFSDGTFNTEMFERAETLTSYLEVKYMKNQLAVANKAKTEIKNSTQSAKIIIGNILENGIPRDIKPDEASIKTFLNANETSKRKMSPLYKLMKEYSETLNTLIENNIQKLLDELNVAKQANTDIYTIRAFDNLIRVLRESAESRGSSVAVLEAIEKFGEERIIELLPNKSRVENILFSIISNRIIRFKRPGDAKPQFAVTGFESGNRSFNSSALKFYEPEFDEAGNITKVNPAEIMMPLPRKMIPKLVNKYKAKLEAEGKSREEIVDKVLNIANLMKLYEEDTDKIIVKGLRIPNQQMSSNDVFVIKKFLPPTKEAYVVVPSEIVVKAGSDFDIDKLQIYFPGDDAYSTLLKHEIDLLLHPSNFHNLLAPVVDDKLKVDILAEVVGELENKLSPAEAKAQAESEALVSKSELHDYTDIVKNIDKFILYIATKAGVGSIATVITTHSVAQADNIELNPVTNIQEGDDVIAISTELPFEGFENQYSLSLTMDKEGQQILEALSMLLTSQVDGAKNPYPSRLNITTQTLNVITLLTRRGVSLSTIIKFVKQPIILQYLQRQRVNESELYQHTRGADKLSLNKNDLVDDFVKSKGIALQSYKSLFNRVRQGFDKISETELEEGITKNTNQDKMLAHFLNLIDVSKNFGAFMRDITADTKPLKDMAAVENVIENYDRLLGNGILKNPEKYRNGMLKPFFEARDLYYKLYINLYFTKNTKDFKNLKDMFQLFASLQRKADDKVKVINEIENDYITYILQNFHPAFKKYTYESIMTGNNSLPKEIEKIKEDVTHPLHDNYAIKNLFTYLNNEGKGDNMRIFERNLTGLEKDDMYDAILDLPADLQEKLIVFNAYQAGNAVNPFQLDEILPVKLKFDMLKQVLKNPNVYNNVDFADFRVKFMLNNPSYLPKSKGAAKARQMPFYTRYENNKLYIVPVADANAIFEKPGLRFSKIYNTISGAKNTTSIDKTTSDKNVEKLTTYYNEHKDKFQAQGITLDNWLAATEKHRKLLIKNCIG